MFRYYIGTHVFPDVLLNDIAGPEGDPLLLSLKLSVDVLVSNGELICYWLAISA
jgi:Cu+-exporting ATPase